MALLEGRDINVPYVQPGQGCIFQGSPIVRVKDQITKLQVHRIRTYPRGEIGNRNGNLEDGYCDRGGDDARQIRFRA